MREFFFFPRRASAFCFQLLSDVFKRFVWVKTLLDIILYLFSAQCTLLVQVRELFVRTPNSVFSTDRIFDFPSRKKQIKNMIRNNDGNLEKKRFTKRKIGIPCRIAVTSSTAHDNSL